MDCSGKLESAGVPRHTELVYRPYAERAEMEDTDARLGLSDLNGAGGEGVDIHTARRDRSSLA